MRTRPHSDSARSQRGIETVEMAIILPLLLFMLVAVAEIARMINQYDALSKAVRDGARYAASASSFGTTGLVYITPATQTAVANLVATGTVNGTGAPLLPGLTPADVTVSAVGPGPTYVQVSVTYTYEPMVGATLPTFGVAQPMTLTVPLTATVVMRAL